MNGGVGIAANVPHNVPALIAAAWFCHWLSNEVDKKLPLLGGESDGPLLEIHAYKPTWVLNCYDLSASANLNQRETHPQQEKPDEKHLMPNETVQ